jgi:hypothetical protein
MLDRLIFLQYVEHPYRSIATRPSPASLKKVKDVDKALGDRVHAVEKGADLLPRHRRGGVGARGRRQRRTV